MKLNTSSRGDLKLFCVLLFTFYVKLTCFRTYEQRLSELHGDEGLAWELVDSRRIEVHFKPRHLDIDLSLNVVPLVIVERFGGAQGHIPNPITYHEDEHHLGSG